MVPAAQYVVKVVTLKGVDATAMATMLQQLFLGTSGTAPRATAPPATAGTTVRRRGRRGHARRGVRRRRRPGRPAGGLTGGTGRPIQLVLNGLSNGVQLTDLRITVDGGTNSLIIAGGPSDIDIIQAVIAKLESTPQSADLQERRSEVYHLRNSNAADVANAVNNFLVSRLNVIRTDGDLTPFQDLEQEVVVVPEPITNKLLISATPRMYNEVMRLVAELDADTPQVMIQVLIAEVDLTGDEEFGVEIGLQSPVLFQRSIFPFGTFIGTGGSVSYANATGGSVAPGVTVNSTVNPSGFPGLNFNQPSLPLGNNVVVSPNVVGTQGLTSLGVGRVSPTSGIGGFVFSAQSDAFNLLIRALKTQGRMDILSRPQVMTLDEQSASVLVGQSVPYITSTNVTATGLLSNGVSYRNVGVELQVTPRIGPDGKVLMRVEPSVSSVANTSISLGNGVTAVAFNVQDVTTTVTAQDGETVAIGGLISRSDIKNENKVPWLGDLPFLGAAFRYRTQVKAKTG